MAYPLPTLTEGGGCSASVSKRQDLTVIIGLRFVTAGATFLPRKNRSALAAFLLLSSLLLSSLGGCASDVPLVIREPPADNPALHDVQRNPTAFVNRRVTWGGIIVSTRSIENRSEVEIRAKALRADGRPELGDVSLGRFLASNDGFLDPAVCGL